ncbi:hypothetical protein B0T17DRAFT_534873 [Bombardia bombarda]|uniref:Uncharacterized protein n=1 Tax=Bombardia bombarda TaxID=252184 RepID=A0AA40C1P8_9PEZI|nr:hypothetical protein B0T17DRAFT_534873 [Bombardia bombarda]
MMFWAWACCVSRYLHSRRLVVAAVTPVGRALYAAVRFVAYPVVLVDSDIAVDGVVLLPLYVAGVVGVIGLGTVANGVGADVDADGDADVAGAGGGGAAAAAAPVLGLVVGAA